MLRRATTGRRLYRHCLSHYPLSQLLLQNTAARCPFSSTSPSLSERDGSRPGNPQNPSSSSSSIEDDGASPEGEQNSDILAMLNAIEDARALGKDPKAPIPARAHTTHRRMRSLRPVLIPPSFESSLLPPVTSIPEPSSSSDGQDTEADPSSSTTTITVTGIHPKTTKADIRPVFQYFGEITRINLQPDRSSAEIIFADVHSVKRTLHAYAERPLRVKGREVLVFRKYTKKNKEPSVLLLPTPGCDTGSIFVANFPPVSTQEELSKALEPFGKVEQIIMRPGSKYAYFVYPNKDHVERTLNSHNHDPITLRGRSLRIELASRNPYNLTPGDLGESLEFAEQLDPVTRSGIIKQLTRTVPKFRGLHDPSRVLWVGRLPVGISSAALANFWSRLGCVVEVRLNTKSGFAHIEFASTEEALRAVSHGAPHGFRYRTRLLDIDFARWEFFIGPAYRVVYISGWPASDGLAALLRWTYDIPYMGEAAILPPFRGERRSDARCAFLQFKTAKNACVALRNLAGRVGPGGEKLDLRLSRLPVVHPSQLWRWVHEVEDMERSGGGEEDACLKYEWEGLGFGTGREEQ